jgi:hypothetical protein
MEMVWAALNFQYIHVHAIFQFVISHDYRHVAEMKVGRNDFDLAVIL